MDQINKTARFWDKREAARPLQFWDLPVIQRYRNRLVSGSALMGRLQWFAIHYVAAPFERGVSLGCGSGRMEREAVRLGIAKSMVGIDIAPERIQKAARLARGLPIEYVRQNINAVRLDEDAFDFALCKTILHHITKLEHVLAELQKALRPGALLYVDDYVGPARFQFPAKLLSIADEMLASLPLEVRHCAHNRWEIKNTIPRITPETIIAADPSEAVRSDEINGLLKRFFTVLDVRSTGGALLFRLLDGIVHNFRPECPEHNSLLEALCAFEERLSRRHMIPDIFKVYVLRNDK